MPCRDTGHHFSALGCGQATKIVMRRGGGPELCVDEVSGVENRQVVSPPQDERLVGQVSAPHPAGVCPAELSQGERPAERVSIFPSSRGAVLRERRVIGEEIRILPGRGPTRQGQSRRAPIGQRSVEQVCLPLPPGRGLPRRTNVQPSRSAGCQRASLPGRQLVGR